MRIYALNARNEYNIYFCWTAAPPAPTVSPTHDLITLIRILTIWVRIDRGHRKST